MKCPNCGKENSQVTHKCKYCSIIFSKFKQKKPIERDYEYSEEPGIFYQLFFGVPETTDSIILGVRIIFFTVFFLWGLKFIFTPLQTNYAGESFWHLINLPFHETGHIIFRPFGRLMASLGGSLMQLIMPLICLGVFIVKTKDTFAAAFTLWWLGESFMDLAPYIDDARALVMPLVGGNTGQTSPYGFHDWEFILTETGLLHHEHTIAWLSQKTGTILMILSFAWSLFLLYKMYKNLKTS